MGFGKFMDPEGTGWVDIEAFIYKLQGDMNTKRSKCVNATFDALSQGQASVSKAEFSNRYKGENGVEWREMIGNANGVTLVQASLRSTEESARRLPTITFFCIT